MSNDVTYVNVEVERFTESGELLTDIYDHVSGYSILKGVLTVVDLDGEDIWSYDPDKYETVSHWEVISD